jgi:hypothetical protein
MLSFPSSPYEKSSKEYAGLVAVGGSLTVYRDELPVKGYRNRVI